MLTILLTLLLSCTLRAAQVNTSESITLQGHSGPVFFLAYPRTDLLISVAADGVRTWDPLKGDSAKGPRGIFRSAAYSDSKKLLAIADNNAAIKIYNTQDWELVNILQLSSGPVASLRFSASAELLAAAQQDGSIKQWETLTWNTVSEFRVARNAVIIAGFDRASQMLATLSRNENILRLWDIKTGKFLYWLKSPHAFSAVYDPQGKQLAAVSADRTLKLWTTEYGYALDGPSLSPGIISAAVFSTDGSLVATALPDGTAGVWDTVSGRQKAATPSFAKQPVSLAFSPEGKYLAAGEYSGNIRISTWTGELWTSSTATVKNSAGTTIANIKPDVHLTVITSRINSDHWLIAEDSGLSGWVQTNKLTALVPDTKPPEIFIASMTYKAPGLSVRGFITDDKRIDQVSFAGKYLPSHDAEGEPPSGPARINFDYSVEINPAIKPVITATDLSGKTSSLILNLDSAQANLTPRTLSSGSLYAQNNSLNTKPGQDQPEQEVIPIGHLNTDGVAVIIGIRDYADTDIPKTEFAIEDARAVKKHLISALGFEQEKIIILENPTKGGLETIFDDESRNGRLKKLVKKGETELFVYYSGHGAADPGEGRAYLVPADARPEYLRQGGYAMDRLYSNLASYGAARVTVVIEACFSGLSHAGPLLKRASPLILVSGKNEKDGLNIFSSSAPEQISSWYPDKHSSLFTYYFLKAIRENCCAKPLKLKMIQDITAAEVSAAAFRMYGRTQTPLFSGNPDTLLIR